MLVKAYNREDKPLASELLNRQVLHRPRVKVTLLSQLEGQQAARRGLKAK